MKEPELSSTKTSTCAQVPEEVVSNFETTIRPGILRRNVFDGVVIPATKDGRPIQKKQVTIADPEVQNEQRSETDTSKGKGRSRNRKGKVTKTNSSGEENEKTSKEVDTNNEVDDNTQKETSSSTKRNRKDQEDEERDFSRNQSPLYKLIPEIRIPGAEEMVARKILEQNIEFKGAEILSVSPRVQAALIRLCKNRKVKPRNTIQSLVTEAGELKDIKSLPPEVLNSTEYIDVDDLRLDNFQLFYELEEDRDGMEAGSIVMRDPVECFLKDVEDSEDKKYLPIIVAKAMDGLRALGGKFNKMADLIECIQDSGSQIIAMDLLVANQLKISWDPDIRINMQDSHGNMGRTEGLARNVRAEFGGIVVYLQIHIQRRAPYHVLLGRPFDVLTESNAKTYANGDVEITITCPVTGKRVTIPTYPRGEIIDITTIDTSRYDMESQRKAKMLPSSTREEKSESEEEDDKENFH